MFVEDESQAIHGETPSKFCSSCAQLRPASEFRRRIAGGERRHTECRSCYNATMRERRRSFRAKELAQYASRLARRSIRPSEVELVSAAMLRRFGGVHRLAMEWSESLAAAREIEPGGRLVLNSMMAIVRLIEAASRGVPPQQDFTTLSDDELNEIVDGHLDRMLDQAMARRSEDSTCCPSVSEFNDSSEQITSAARTASRCF